MIETPHDPTWLRLGFPEAPDAKTSGENVGIVIIDTLKAHQSIQHLKKRLIYITIHDDFTIEVRTPAFEEPQRIKDFDDEHGLLSLLSLAHQPYEINGKLYTGLAPAATFLVLNHGAFRVGEGERLKKGINWILERQEKWNIKIVLSMGWHALDNPNLLKNTQCNSTVKALTPVLDKDILVICANGNSRITNILPPVDYLVVGGYNDRGSADIKKHVPHTDESWGFNGDGHMRPDVLGPRTYLPVPINTGKNSKKSFAYFGGTSGSSTIVAGICAYLFSKFPRIDSQLIRNILREQGEFIDNYEHPAPKVNVMNVLKALEKGYTNNKPPKIEEPITVDNPSQSIHSVCQIERALSLSYLVGHSLCSRESLWIHTLDSSHIVRNIAVSALQKPLTTEEREKFWTQLHDEDEGGVRGLYMYGLLKDAKVSEVESWIPWANDHSWPVRWCLNEYLLKYEGFPKLDLTPDPDLINEKANALYEAFKKYKSEKL